MAKIDYDVGDLVVCVDARGLSQIKEGVVYTVAAFDFTPGYSMLDGATVEGVYLQEADPNPGDYGFDVRRFRKLPKKSREFFAGETQTVRDLVPAT